MVFGDYRIGGGCFRDDPFGDDGIAAGGTKNDETCLAGDCDRSVINPGSVDGNRGVEIFQ